MSNDGKYLLVSAEEDLGPVQLFYVDLEEFFRGGLKPKPPLINIVDNFLAEYYVITHTYNVPLCVVSQFAICYLEPPAYANSIIPHYLVRDEREQHVYIPNEQGGSEVEARWDQLPQPW